MSDAAQRAAIRIITQPEIMDSSAPEVGVAAIIDEEFAAQQHHIKVLRIFCESVHNDCEEWLSGGLANLDQEDLLGGFRDEAEDVLKQTEEKSNV